MNIFTATTGINNKLPAVRRPVEGGVVTLEATSDVVIDKSGALYSRGRGEKVIDGSFHSLYEVDGGFIACKERTSDAALMYLAVSGSSVTEHGIRSKLTKGSRVSYTKIGETIYYMNGYESGQLKRE